MLNVQTPWLGSLELRETGTGIDKSKKRISITVILDQPFESDDAFELVSGDGSYKKRLGAGQAVALVPGKKVLRFDGIDAAKPYQLTHFRSKSSKRIVLPLRPATAMTEAGQWPRSSEYVYLTLPGQPPARMAGQHGVTDKVDADLIARSPLLLDVPVEDPKV